jgi:hypothetical protein
VVSLTSELALSPRADGEIAAGNTAVRFMASPFGLKDLFAVHSCEDH